MSSSSDVKELYYGVVIWFSASPGYGFIQWEKDGVPQADMFVYYCDINVQGFKVLYKGQKVSFNIGTNNHGKPKAINVNVLYN